MKQILIAVSLIVTTTFTNIWGNHQAKPHGSIIAAYGLPGSGKSSVFRALSKLMDNATLLGEPEVDHWPEYTSKTELMDPFTFMMAMRTRRVAELRLADKLREQGSLVLVEPYYAKVDHLLLDKQCLHWFFPQSHPYFDLAFETLKRDAESLPNADVVIIFDIDYDTWIKFLNARNRDMDKGQELRNSYNMIEHWPDVESFLQKKGTRVIHFKQVFSSPEEQAVALKNLLIKEHVL